MKKIILILVVALSTFNAFANNETSVNQKVLQSFNTEFANATEISWTAEDGYFRAAFVYSEKHFVAYYSEQGDLLGLTRYMSSTELPILLQNSLKKNYAGYWISDLFEISKPEGNSYYVTVEDADSKIVLRAENNSWTVFKKSKKA